MHSPFTPQTMVCAAQVVALFAEVKVDLGARTARTELRHLPEVFLAPEEQNMRRVEARLCLPNIGGFVIARNVALIIFKTGGVEFILGQTPHIGEQLPRPGDGFLFVVIAKRPVAEHFKEGVMRVVAAHIFEVVVLARHAHTLLRVDGAFVRALYPCR